MIKYGEFITNMFEEEAKYYDKEFFHTFQVDFDYTHYLKNITAQIYVIYGDRGLPKYENKLSDLNLDDKILNKIQIRFISNSCHMMMMENPQELQKV
jgi:pimeloyl-ACP methyl ester carboxylesterase